MLDEEPSLARRANKTEEPSLARRAKKNEFTVDSNLYRLILSGCWFIVGILFLCRKWIGMEGFDRFIKEENVPLFIAACFAFAFFNVIRWWLRRPKPSIRTLIEEDRQRRSKNGEDESDDRPFEYDPQLDFSRKDPVTPPTDPPRSA